MKYLKIIIPIAFLLVAFSSCKKCVSCKVERLNTVIEAEYDEFCGTTEDIDAFKQDIQEKLVGIPGSEDMLIICTEK